MKRIAHIDKIFEGGMTQYRIKLCSNFSFDFNGCDVAYALSIKEAFEFTKHIVFCNGTN